MKHAKYLGIRPGDLEGKPYAQYWNPEMAPLPAHIHNALAHGPEAPELAFPYAELDQLLEPGYLALENGYTRLPNGQIFVAVLTPMPRVTAAMIDWWFGWHYMESQRYKLWHPRAHIANRAQHMVGDNPTLSDREKYLQNPNYVTEYIGNTLLEIKITFQDPAELVNPSHFANTGIETMICGTVSHPKLPINISKLVHQIRKTNDGCEMRSRFWMAHLELSGALAFLNPFAPKHFLAHRALSLSQGRDLLAHCAMEMTHLASFLPALFANYHEPTHAPHPSAASPLNLPPPRPDASGGRGP